VWHTDSCVVCIDYTPTAYLDGASSMHDLAFPELQCDIMYKLHEHIGVYERSTVWTKQTLGIE
jgi:hypothetical protein